MGPAETRAGASSRDALPASEPRATRSLPRAARVAWVLGPRAPARVARHPELLHALDEVGGAVARVLEHEPEVLPEDPEAEARDRPEEHHRQRDRRVAGDLDPPGQPRDQE